MPGLALFRLLAAAMVLLAMAGCAGPNVVRDPVPERFVDAAQVPGYELIRFWGDDATGPLTTLAEIQAKQLLAAARADSSIDLRRRYFLAISGGGSNGAFGAGLLVGWSAAGGRPSFDVVTGVSTGSLIAPFAFLGPAYDGELKASYTDVTSEDIYKTRSIFGIFADASVADDTPLRRMITGYITEDFLDKVAREHARGRRLLVGTTNLDAERPVIWNMGAIAASGEPNRRQLFIDILIASASVPGVFPPVRLKVTVDGRAYDELHVDGGTTNQVFLLPTNFSANIANKTLGFVPQRTLYIIRNGRVDPEWSAVKVSLPAIAGKSLNSLIKTQGIGDLFRIYVSAKRDGIDFNAIWIPPEFTMKEPKPFDPGYMQALFDFGYSMALKGIPWSKVPPN